MRLASARWRLALTYISIAVRRNPKNPPATKSQRRVPTIGIVLHHEHDPSPGCCVDGGDDVAVSTLIGTLPNADIGGDPLSVAVKVTVYEPTSFADGVQEKWPVARSEEHTSELQSPYDLVCRLLLEKKKCNKTT